MIKVATLKAKRVISEIVRSVIFPLPGTST
jgi:hypothetical protein